MWAPKAYCIHAFHFTKGLCTLGCVHHLCYCLALLCVSVNWVATWYWDYSHFSFVIAKIHYSVNCIKKKLIRTCTKDVHQTIRMRFKESSFYNLGLLYWLYSHCALPYRLSQTTFLSLPFQFQCAKYNQNLRTDWLTQHNLIRIFRLAFYLLVKNRKNRLSLEKSVNSSNIGIFFTMALFNCQNLCLSIVYVLWFLLLDKQEQDF